MLATLALTLLAGSAVASPVARDLKWYTSDIEIHSSCNATQKRMLTAALADTFEVVSFAQEYAQKNGPQDPVFQTYFGTDKTAYPKALGVFESILTSNKQGVLLRCDNIDGNCGQPGWRGHWRGDNATQETVICDLSYTDRLYNEAFCMFGFQLATSAKSDYWSIDLIHRLLHVPQVSGDSVHHYIEEGSGLEGVLELAEHNSTYAPFDSDAIQYFAAHVYAVEVAKGGDACIGTFPDPHGEHAASSSSSTPASTSAAASSAAATSAATSSAAAATSSAAAAATSSAASAGADCHTHADGSTHCV